MVEHRGLWKRWWAPSLSAALCAVTWLIASRSTGFARPKVLDRSSASALTSTATGSAAPIAEADESEELTDPDGPIHDLRSFRDDAGVPGTRIVRLGLRGYARLREGHTEGSKWLCATYARCRRAQNDLEEDRLPSSQAARVRRLRSLLEDLERGLIICQDCECPSASIESALWMRSGPPREDLLARLIKDLSGAPAGKGSSPKPRARQHALHASRIELSRWQERAKPLDPEEHPGTRPLELSHEVVKLRRTLAVLDQSVPGLPRRAQGLLARHVSEFLKRYRE